MPQQLVQMVLVQFYSNLIFKNVICNFVIIFHHQLIDTWTQLIDIKDPVYRQSIYGLKFIYFQQIIYYL